MLWGGEYVNEFNEQGSQVHVVGMLLVRYPANHHVIHIFVWQLHHNPVTQRES